MLEKVADIHQILRRKTLDKQFVQKNRFACPRAKKQIRSTVLQKIFHAKSARSAFTRGSEKKRLTQNRIDFKKLCI